MAKELRIGFMAVQRIIKKAQSKPRFLEELVAERDRNKAHRFGIAAAIKKMNDDNKIIDSVAMLREVLKDEHQIVSKDREVRSVLRDILEMRYKKIKEVSIYSNSNKNLVLRQQFALEFLRQW